ncbi:MAG: hypothetical protein J2P47_16885 [Acetobacteraceae bacterium]|nr:hypothetical protein [Acetobacteraceae bacterium]
MASEDQQDGGREAVPTHRLEHDFSVVLARTIEAVQHNPAQFRNLIYEMARVQLQREAWRHSSKMSLLELGRTMLALETAIERVETHAAQDDAIPALAPSGLAAALDATSAHDEVVRADQPPKRARPGRAAGMADIRMTTRPSAPLRAIVRLGVLALLTATVVIVFGRASHLLSPAPRAAVQHVAAPSPTTPAAQAAVAPHQQPATPSPASSGPLPSVYGVYAVSRGRLYELEPLVGRAPDLRMFMSWVIKTPSHTVLPDGDVSFIVYRRDIASSAPDRGMVRVIAKIAQSMTFTKAGQAVTTNVDGEWAIRNVSFDYRVAPSSESPEMILVKPDNEAPALPAGRYALIIKGQMFDFTVDGPITQTAQCLERTEAANGTFYSECRQLR